MQINSTFSINFFTRKSRTNSNRLPIYSHITVGRKRSEISLKRSIYIKEWDSFKNRGRGSANKIDC